MIVQFTLNQHKETFKFYAKIKWSIIEYKDRFNTYPESFDDFKKINILTELEIENLKSNFESRFTKNITNGNYVLFHQKPSKVSLDNKRPYLTVVLANGNILNLYPQTLKEQLKIKPTE